MALVFCLDRLVPFLFVLLSLAFYALCSVSAVCGLIDHLVEVIIIDQCLFALLSVADFWLISILELLDSEVDLALVDGQLWQE